MIRSITGKRAKAWKEAFQNRDFRTRKQFGIHGQKIVQHAVNAGIVREVMYVSSCPVRFDNAVEVSRQVMDYLTYGSEDSVAAICEKPVWNVNPEMMHRIVILDHLHYQINIGTILHYAYLFGADAVYLPDDGTVNPFGQTAAESSQGTLFHLPVLEENLPALIRRLKDCGFTCVGTSLQNALPLSKIPARDKMAIILGNEAQGASEEVLKEANVLCRIEMENYDSLNVSIAAGIVLHRFRPR